MAGSLPSDRQYSWLRRSTASALCVSSVARNVRPSTGRTCSMSKKLADTTPVRTRRASPPPSSVKSIEWNSTTSSNEWLIWR